MQFVCSKLLEREQAWILCWIIQQRFTRKGYIADLVHWPFSSLITFKHLSHFSMETFISEVVNQGGWQYVKFSLGNILWVKFDLIALWGTVPSAYFNRVHWFFSGFLLWAWTLKQLWRIYWSSKHIHKQISNSIKVPGTSYDLGKAIKYILKKDAICNYKTPQILWPEKSDLFSRFALI